MYTSMEGSWDTHHHIFERTCYILFFQSVLTILAANTFSYSATRHLTPPPATIEKFKDFKAQNRICKSVLVHGLSYGHDCSSLTAFLHQLDPSVTRGVCVINRSTTDAEIAAFHACGIRGIRLDLYEEGAMRDLDKQTEMLKFYARRISSWGWSMAFLQLAPENWEPLSFIISSLTVNVVVDHHALMKAQSMLPDGIAVEHQPGMQAIIRLLKAGNFWVKLSAPYRCSEAGPDYYDMKEVVRCLVDANPRRVVWGSDW